MRFVIYISINDFIDLFLRDKSHYDNLFYLKHYRLVYDPHTLKPVKRSLRSCCSPRVAELSVPKKGRVYCTWTQYHDRLAPAKVDRLYELLTLQIPNRFKTGTRNCSQVSFRSKLGNNDFSRIEVV